MQKAKSRLTGEKGGEKRLLMTGGHLTPALAFIDWLQREHPEVEIIFAGREYAQAGNGQKSWERSEVEKRGITFVPWEAGKSGAWSVAMLAGGVVRARDFLREQKITQVLSWGGYLALPFALAGKWEKIKVVTHEQTRVLGRANRLISVVADRIAVSFPETKTWFPRKTVVTGNPLREGLWDKGAKKPKWWERASAEKPILYVAGGSQGSRAINEAILPVVEQLLRDFVVVHVTGRPSWAYNPENEVEAYVKKNLVNRKDYINREWLSVEEMAYVLPRIEVAISRAGANTVAELTAFRVPTIYVPLPQSNYREQERNAAAVAEKGGALILPQSELLPAELMIKIGQVERERKKMGEALKKMPTERLANERIWELMA